MFLLSFIINQAAANGTGKGEAKSTDLQYFISVSDVVVVNVDIQRLLVVEAVVVFIHVLTGDSLLGFHANEIYLNNS